jgi:N-acetyl-beta-hexosaminidase
MGFLSTCRFLLSVLALSACTVLSANPVAEKPSLLPVPQKITWNFERFCLAGKDPHSDPRIRMKLVARLEAVPANMDEAYRLVVTSDSVLIEATGDEGFFRAFATLDQLTGSDTQGDFMAGCEITDWPAFRIRGYMHDTGRSFIPVEELKREIRVLSGFKINTFHWHLTEDIAWRLASDVIPELTSAEVTLRDKEGYYTREEVADFVRYCNEHFVEVIPEIDMPGHSAAFTRATGYTMQSEEGKEIVRQLLAEACTLSAATSFT